MKPLALVGALALFGAASAADRFVSDDGTWVMPGMSGTCYTDLQTAVGKASGGDTVWVKNGFVCDSGIMESWNHETNRIWVTKGITIRSECGYVDEAAGKKATIRGLWDGKTDNSDFKCTPVYLCDSGAVLQGFVIENGYGQQNASWAGGGVRNSSGTVSNCVVRNCKCARGGGICGGKVYNTVVTNCTVRSDGSGSLIYGAKCVIGCTLANGTVKPALQWNDATTDEIVVSNTTVACSAGGLYVYGKMPNLTVVDSVISNNVAADNGGGLRGNSNGRIRVLRTKIVDNSCEGSSYYAGGGAYCCDLTKCDLVGNICKNGSGGAASNCILTDCQLISNQATRVNNSGAGAGASSCILTNCVIAFNANTNTLYKPTCVGGGIDASTAVNCRIYGNISPYAGGGASGSTLYNCIVTNNLVTGDMGGGGAYNSICYNVLFAKNKSHRGAGGLYVNNSPSSCAINCTFAENVIESGLGGFRSVPLVENSISWGNTGTYDPDSCTTCRNSCLKKVSATESSGIVTTDPKLRTVDGKPYVPGARACRNVLTPADWMTDANDIRSKDVYGNPRVSGAKADMGAVEAVPQGLSLLLR